MGQIIVYCGNDIVSSRKAFLDQLQSLKERNFEVVRILGKDVKEEQLELLSSPATLFGQKQCLAIEELLSGQKNKEREKVLMILSASSFPVFVWESKEFSKPEQTKFGKEFVFKNFKLPEVLFKYLEKLSPGKISENLSLFHRALESVDPTYIFIMLVRQIRLLILVAEDEAGSLPSWQVGKLCQQTQQFKKEKLYEIYKRLLEIDFQQKTSILPFSLSQSLDLLITKI